jgi:hypothetical protein
LARHLHSAFAEMEAVASGIRCKKPLYHAKISPDSKDCARPRNSGPRRAVAKATGHKLVLRAAGLAFPA